MNWILLAELLLRLVGPVLAEWLDALINRPGPLLGDYPVETPAAIRAWFAAARARTSWYELRARARLLVLERVALSKAGEIAAAVRFGAADPVLTKAEASDIALSL
jgi:hypothetical protein